MSSSLGLSWVNNFSRLHWICPCCSNLPPSPLWLCSYTFREVLSLQQFWEVLTYPYPHHHGCFHYQYPTRWHTVHQQFYTAVSSTKSTANMKLCYWIFLCFDLCIVIHTHTLLSHTVVSLYYNYSELCIWSFPASNPWKPLLVFVLSIVIKIWTKQDLVLVKFRWLHSFNKVYLSFLFCHSLAFLFLNFPF